MNNCFKSETQRINNNARKYNVEDANKTEAVGDSNEQPENASKAFESILHRCGDYHLYQWKLTFVTGFCGLFTSLHNFGAVYLAATPEYYCAIPYLQDENSTIIISLLNETVPWVRDKEGNMKPSKCQYYDYDNFYYTTGNHSYDPGEQLPNASDRTRNCESWNYDNLIFKSTVVTEWNLVCDKRWMMSTTQASYMVGILTGAVVFSIISDKFGRRFSSLICTVLFISASISAAFVKSFVWFLILRFIVAASGQGMYLVNYVLLSLKGRNIMGNISHGTFPIGFLSLNLYAYLLRDWRDLQMALSFPTVLLMFHFWLLPESSRWLLMEGREEEGLELLKEIAITNKKEFMTEEKLRLDLDAIKNEVQNKPKLKGLKRMRSIFQSIADLVRTRNMRRRNLIMFYIWFVVSMIFYGLVFSGGNLNASIYATVSLTAATSIPTCIALLLLLIVFGRRTLLFWSLLLAGISSISIMFVPTDMIGWKLGLAIFGQVNIGCAFDIIFMLSAELVPTHIRNISLGIASMFARIGSGVAPYIVDLLGDIYYAIPFIVFGILSLLAALLTLFLPETGNKRLPESIKEIEEMSR